MELNWNFQKGAGRGWGGGGEGVLEKNPFSGRGMDTFWKVLDIEFDSF